ncbi:DUF1611 domain-containing protein [Leifsonia sp. AG29]|uniref:DUF1611 domain-containing protein n=1 Tax=Leifsonia sp. AG29 TaxID=2598860 RepID=UPI0018EEE5E1|nr:DUF1611 domain-containing protein [Leifsonia sp. AG29]
MLSSSLDAPARFRTGAADASSTPVSPVSGPIPTLGGPVPAERLLRAKAAYSTRYLAAALAEDATRYHLESALDTVPQPGDIVLARVEELGHLSWIEGPGSRRQTLFAGDEVLVAYGHRYAPDAVLAEVPGDLGPCHLIAAGGVAGSVLAAHGSMAAPTTLSPIGMLADAGGRLTLPRLAPHRASSMLPVSEPGSALDAPRVVVVLGTSMNSGKSTAAANLVHGLSASGLRVAAGKATGTAAGGDPNMFRDAGAIAVADFTDFGYPTTFRVGSSEILGLFHSLVDVLAAAGPDVIVIEIADGVYQDETRGVLGEPSLQARVDRLLFAATDALGAVAGIAELRSAGLSPAAVSGMVTVSPLASREAAARVGVPVIGTFELARAEVARELLG